MKKNNTFHMISNLCLLSPTLSDVRALSSVHSEHSLGVRATSPDHAVAFHAVTVPLRTCSDMNVAKLLQL